MRAVICTQTPTAPPPYICTELSPHTFTKDMGPVQFFTVFLSTSPKRISFTKSPVHLLWYLGCLHANMER